MKLLIKIYVEDTYWQLVLVSILNSRAMTHMETLDLQKIRCPMLLVKLKRYLLLHDRSSNKQQDSQLCLLFSNQQAMQDIMLYLDKKKYDYSSAITDNQVSLVMRISANN